MAGKTVESGGTFKPGHAKKGGRKPGVPNKLTGDIKAMILAALDKAGGEAYLVDQALNNPNAFLTLVGKVLPMTVQGPNGEAPKVHVTVEYV